MCVLSSELVYNKKSFVEENKPDQCNQLSAATEKQQLFTHHYPLDKNLELNFTYPINSDVKEIKQKDYVEIIIIPPYKYDSLKKQISIKLEDKRKEPKFVTTKDIEKIINQKHSQTKEFIFGVLPTKISNIPSYGYYYEHCEEWGIDCRHTNVFYSNAFGFLTTITASHSTDEYGLPINDQELQTIVDSITFFEQK